MEQLAFDYCPHGLDGFTWEEVQDCEVQNIYFSYFYIYTIFQDYISKLTLQLELPTKADFDMIDMGGDNDGVLTMEEWAHFVGSQE